jgi:MFS family permease
MSRSRPLRAMFLNAVAWSAAWAIAGGAIFTVLQLFSSDPSIESLPERIGMALFAGVAFGVRFGIAGAVIGTIFSALIRWGYRGRRLADINPLKFAVLGAVVGGVGVPLFLQLMNVLSGDGPIAWRLVLDDGPWAAVFGAVAAAGSIVIARRATALPRELHADELEPPALPSRPAQSTAAAPRDRTHRTR